MAPKDKNRAASPTLNMASTAIITAVSIIIISIKTIVLKIFKPKPFYNFVTPSCTSGYLLIVPNYKTVHQCRSGIWG
jgi:hypothetical protein